ncbi:MAG: hypothetical protein JXA46_16215 [Dehalococcoidales bacterium]|nr:hypothetical protein [Dehalococcoidales bacterium]
MKDLVLDLINSYEERVVMVESLIENAYEAASDSDKELSRFYDDTQKLRDDLREILVKNCSLRRKDFDAYTAVFFSSIEKKKNEIENERKLVREILKAYLNRQKDLVIELKTQLEKFSSEGSNKSSLEMLLSNMKNTQKEEGEQTFSLLRDIQLRLKIFRLELADLNSNLQRILERGELLKLEDLRQFQSAMAQERRKAERKERKEDVERMLAEFNRKRQEITN